MPDAMIAPNGVRQPVRSADPSLLEPVAVPAVETKDNKKQKKPKATGKKRLVKPIILLLVGFALFHEISPKFIKPHYSAAHPAPPGGIIELTTASGTDTITTNLADGHLAQLSISLQMTSVASTKEEQKDEDALMGETIAIIGDQTYNELLAPSGRQALAASLLSAYQHELGDVDGSPQVTGVYFTSYVLQ